MDKKKSAGAQLVAQRYDNMTPEERSAAARNAAVKRWAKVKKTAKPGAKKKVKKNDG